MLQSDVEDVKEIIYGTQNAYKIMKNQFACNAAD